MRLILAEDSALLREGLARTLAARGIEVTGEAPEPASLYRLVDEDPPDVVLLDLRMPPTYADEGMQAAEQIRAAHPGVAVLLLSQYADIALAARLVETLPRAAGYLLKERIGETGQLIDALHRVTRGEVVLDPDLVRALVSRRRACDPLWRLSERERAVLSLMAEGRSNAGIAGRLYLSSKSVERNVAAVFDKLALPPDSDDNRRVLAVIAFLRAPTRPGFPPQQGEPSQWYGVGPEGLCHQVPASRR